MGDRLNGEVEAVGALTEEELLARVSPPPLPAVFITARRYAEENGCAEVTALRILRDHAAAGLVRERKALVDGRERWIFY